jgi:hypothetical protein
MHYIDDAANILVHNYKHEVPPLTILDVADQLDKSSEEVIRDVLESISISAIMIKLNNIYKYKYTYIENRYRRSYFRKEMHPRDYIPYNGGLFRILP